MYPNSLLPSLPGPILTAIKSITEIKITGERIGDDLTNVLEPQNERIIADLCATLRPIKALMETTRMHYIACYACSSLLKKRKEIKEEERRSRDREAARIDAKNAQNRGKKGEVIEDSDAAKRYKKDQDFYQAVVTPSPLAAHADPTCGGPSLACTTR